MLLGPLPCGMSLVAGPRENVDRCTVALKGCSLAMRHITSPPLLWSNQVTWLQLSARSKQGSACLLCAMDRSGMSVSRPKDNHAGWACTVCLAIP